MDIEKEKESRRISERKRRAKMTPEQKKESNKRSMARFRKRYQEDAEFRLKCKLRNTARLKKRYREDEEFRQKCLASQKAWREKHKEELLAKARAEYVHKKPVRLLYGIDTSDKKLYFRVWRANNKERIKAYNKRSIANTI